MYPSALSLQFRIFFFFQAEDGIRDVAVTGVQTCALPILRRIHSASQRLMTQSRSHLAGTTPFQNRIPVRLLAPQHVKGRLGQMARHCSNGFVVSLALAQTVIELADVPLRTAPVIDGHRVGGLHKCPLQIAVHVRSQPAVPHAAAAGVHPWGGSCIAGQMRASGKRPMSPISSAMGAARISAIPASVISRSISGVTSTKSSSRCSSCRICRTRKSICASNCLQTQRVCSGNGSIRASSSARALFPYASLYSLGGTPYLASVAVRRFFSRVRCSTSTSRVRVNSRKSRNGLGGIHTVGSVPLRCRRLSPCTSSLSVLLISPIISLALRG